MEGTLPDAVNHSHSPQDGWYCSLGSFPCGNCRCRVPQVPLTGWYIRQIIFWSSRSLYLDHHHLVVPLDSCTFLHPMQPSCALCQTCTMLSTGTRNEIAFLMTSNPLNTWWPDLTFNLCQLAAGLDWWVIPINEGNRLPECGSITTCYSLKWWGLMLGSWKMECHLH